MATMNISLPDKLRDFVTERVEGGTYANASDYVRDLIRRDAEMLEKLRAEIDKGLASGTSTKTVQMIFAEAKAAYRQKAKKTAKA